MRFKQRFLATDVTWASLIVSALLVFAAPHELHGDQPVNGRASWRSPYAYLFPATLNKLTEHLQREGIEVCELREDIDLDVEVYLVEKNVRAQKQPPRPAPTHIGRRGGGQRQSIRLKTRRLPQVPRFAGTQTRRFYAGTILVKTQQKSEDKAGKILDPNSKKPPEVRRLFGRLKKGDYYPIVKLNSYVPITQGGVKPLPEKRQFNKPITFETVYGPENKASFGGSPVSGLTWLQDGEHYLQVRDGRLYKVHAVSGRSTPFFDPNQLCNGLRSLPTMSEKTAQSLSKQTQFEMNPDRSAILIDYENDLYYCSLNGGAAIRLTSSPGKEKYSTFSPAGKFVAFVREKNLYVVDIATQTERALTTDGGKMIANGEADWVYSEEVFSHPRTFWWSPDSSAIAFLQFDDRPVNEFTVVNDVGKKQDAEVSPYPKAGEPNPKVNIGVVSAAGGEVRWIDLDTYTEGTYLVTRLGWMPDSEKIYFCVQDRAQTWLDFNVAPKSPGETSRLFRETTQAWVEPPDSLKFLADQSFLLLSERTGWKHLYLYDGSGQLKHAVTAGEWEARRLHQVDEKNGWIYISATRDSHIAENLYRVKIDGSGIDRLTKLPGDHYVNVSPNGEYFIDTWSNSSTPAKVALYATDGTRIRMLDTNPVYEREEYRFGTYEQFQIETSDGFLLEASLIKPPDFDSSKKYPVWFMTYGGPHSPTISDAWRDGRARDHMLAQMGMLVFRCDPRSAGGKGACSAWSAYKQLGVQELKDIEEALDWLKEQPYVDGSRIGMSGHSYGGFLTAYALTHSKSFVGGIAGAPVTDWRLYDTIYTERYMDVPQNNPQGYEKTSVIEAAKNLHGRLLIVHGAIDDNVHLENTFKLLHALQQADKEFELMIYPQSRHGIGGMHYNRLVLNFIKTVLQLDN
jgi:dipeptidyl aminopeptidase/acylaminoacyl peptidase